MYQIENHYKEELKQSYTRITFIVIITLVLVYMNFHLEKELLVVNVTMGIITLLTLLHLLFLYKFPKKLLSQRKTFTIIMDIAATTVFVFYLDELGILFTPMYFWIILGNGVRFGMKYLLISIGTSLFCISMILLYSTYWQNNPLVLYALELAIIVVPLFVAKLLKRLIHQSEELHELLRLTEHQSKHDSLTDLPNRTYFDKLLQKYIEEETGFALYFIDLDGFKGINDNLGHSLGDAILKIVAKRLKETMPESSFVSRFGGDEFILIVKDDSIDHKALAQKIITELSVPYTIQSKNISLSASIGISYYPEDTHYKELIIQYADKAMYHVKSMSKNSFIEYSELNTQQ